MAYDLVKQTHPGAPCALGIRVVESGTRRVGSIAPPRAGFRGVAVRFDGHPFVEDCEPGSLAFASPPPAPWPAR